MSRFEDFPALASQRSRLTAEEEKLRAYEELFCLDAAAALLANAKTPDKEEILPVFRDFVDSAAPFARLHLAALAFARFLKKRFGALPPPEEFSPVHALPQEICYVKNPYIQRVIDASRLSARWFYAEDFDAACSQVSDGARGGCILPYLDAENAPMPGIERLISDYGLKKQRLFRFDLDGRSGGALLLGASLRLPASPALLELQFFPEKELLLREALALLREEAIPFSPPAFLQRGDELQNAPLSCTLCIEIKSALPEIPLYALSLLVPDLSLAGCYDVERLTDSVV